MQALKKKISEELMPIAWHPERWWNFCMSEDEKKRNRTEFYWVVEQVCVGSIQYRGIETFWDRKLCMNFLVWFLVKIF